MNEDIRVYLLELPARVRAYTVRKDDYYTIVVNSILDKSQQLEVYEHELEHIQRGDFDSPLPVGLIENYAHKK